MIDPSKPMLWFFLGGITLIAIGIFFGITVKKKTESEAFFVLIFLFGGFLLLTLGTFLPLSSYMDTNRDSSIVESIEGKYEVSVVEVDRGSAAVRTEQDDSLYKFEYLIESNEVELINSPNSSVTVEQLLR